MDARLKFPTDCALIALFDPQVASKTVTSEEALQLDSTQIKGVRNGDLSIVSLGGDGVYQIRITDEGLSADERDYAAAVVGGLGVRVESGTICVSGYGFDSEGITAPCPNGLYDVTIYEIAFYSSPRWWRPDDQLPPDAPPDYVALLTPRKNEFRSPEEQLRLDSLLDWEPGPQKFLFESTTRVVGAQPGMELESKVINSRDGFFLKACGPDDYKAELPNYDGLKWKDRVRFVVTAVDHENMLIRGELVRKLD